MRTVKYVTHIPIPKSYWEDILGDFLCHSYGLLASPGDMVVRYVSIWFSMFHDFFFTIVVFLSFLFLTCHHSLFSISSMVFQLSRDCYCNVWVHPKYCPKVPVLCFSVVWWKFILLFLSGLLNWHCLFQGKWYNPDLKWRIIGMDPLATDITVTTKQVATKMCVTFITWHTACVQ